MVGFDRLAMIYNWLVRDVSGFAASAALVVVALLGIGLMPGQQALADDGRSCGDLAGGVFNSIANNPTSGGGCGALTPGELITDIHNGNPDDQAAVFAHFGLPASDYGRFTDEAIMGVAKQNGDIIVEGQKVMTNAWSIGRVHFAYATPYEPLSSVGNFFKSAHTDVLKQDLPVMVLFDHQGTVQTAVLTSCGNPVNGEKVKSRAFCKMLNKTPVEGRKNTFTFTADVRTQGFAKVIKVQYFANGELFATEDNPSTPVTKTFTESATITVEVTISVPGKNNTRQINTEKCTAEVIVEKKEVPPPEKPKEQPKKPKPKVLSVTSVQQPMPVTGPSDVAGLFVGTALAGTVGHRLYAIYRGRRHRK